MNDYCNESTRRGTAVSIEIWENEGGAPGRDPMDHQYGRRIETNRSWTVYHVFSGVPARIGGDAMIGLSHRDATERMISLNLRNIGRRRERLSALGPNVCEIGAGGS